MQRLTARYACGLGFLASISIACAGSRPPVASAPAPARGGRLAQTMIDEAVATAAAEKKAVMVKFSASWCIPCRQLERFLSDSNEAGQIMRANYVIVTLVELETPDKVMLENPGGKEWSKSMGADLTAMGFPFFIILDSKGKKLADSNLMPLTGNIGFPQEIEEVAEFDGLLQRTAPHMTVAERGKIKVYLDHIAGRTSVQGRP